MQINLCGKISHCARLLPCKLLLAMKLTIFIILGAFLQVSATVNAQRITLSEKNTSTTVILNKIQQQSGYDIFYKNNLVKDAKISIQLNGVSLETALKTVLDHQNLEFSIEDKLITIREGAKQKVPLISRVADPIKIKGTIEDEDGNGLSHATIQVLGKNLLTMHADLNGAFTIGIIAGDTALRISYVGFRTKVVKLENGRITYNIRMNSVDAKLNDVVVTGIFDKPKESFTGAVTVISKEQIKMFGNRNLLKTIGNIDPSFNIQETNQYGSDPNIMPSVTIRGNSTLPTDLSNVQSTNVQNKYNLPLFILDGFEISLERVVDMNQYDVESVVILKDASSTAAYGARGANGVIVITSIKPVAGKLRVSYSAAMNMEIPDFSSYNLLNATQKLAAEKRVGLYTSSSLSSQDILNTLYNQNLKSTMEGVNTNWLKVPTQTGVSQTHQLGLSGGDNEFRYTLNGSYNQVTGAMKGSKRDNFNGGFSIMYLLKKVRFTNNLSIGFNNSSNSPWGSFDSYTILNPYWAPYDSNGNAVKQFATFGSQYQQNPAYDGTLPGFDKTKYTVIRNTTSVDWDIIKGLKWSNSVGYSRQIGSTNKYLSRSNSAFQSNAASTSGSYSLTNSYAQGYQVRSNVSYGTVLGKSTVYGGVNVQATEDKQNDSGILATGFSTDTQTDLSQAITVNRPTTSESTNRTVGAMATASYNYDSRFFADGNYNLTGGSSFGPQSRFGKFWSAGVGWTVSNERFMKDNLPQINSMRLRYNYGVTGNLNFSPYQALSTYTYDRTQLYRSLAGTNLTGFANQDLKWQSTHEQDFGVDLGLFDNKLSLSANYYIKKTTNTIASVYLPYSHGFTTYLENLGQINNTGTDITATVYVIKNPGRKFYWSVTAAASHNRNVLVKLSDALKKASAASSAGINSSNSTAYQYVEGQSMDEVYVVPSPGVDAATGKVLYLKADGTVTTDISGVAKVPVGDGNPKIDGRLSSMVRIGQFTANVGFAGRFGAKKVNYTLLTKVENAYVRNNVDQRVFDLRWQQPGDITGFKSINSQTATYANTRFVYTETTILLNNINMNYALPTRWVKRLNMQQINIGASMSDIGYWSNIDQERGTSYPYTLKPSFTLSAIF